MDERIALAKQCQTSDSSEILEKLLLTPTADDALLLQSGDDTSDDDSDNGDCKIEIRALHRAAVAAGHKAYDAFHEVIDGFKRDKPKDVWEERIGAAVLVAKDALIAALDKFAADSKAVIHRLVDEEELRLEGATYFNYCMNGYVLFSRKVNEALELVYESRKGGQQRVWTALDTSGRTVREAEAA